MTTFGEPDWVVFNGGCFKSDPQVEDVFSQTSVSLNLEQGESVILGTEYAGEMKKGLFTVMPARANQNVPSRAAAERASSAENLA